MHDKPTDKLTTDRTRPGLHPLRMLSAEQFAALGLESVVFSRTVDTQTLVRLVPDADVAEMAGPFILVMSADGKPILVTDSPESVDDWLDDQPVVLARVH